MRHTVGEGFQFAVCRTQLARARRHPRFQRAVERLHGLFRPHALCHVLDLHQSRDIDARLRRHWREGQLHEAGFTATTLHAAGQAHHTALEFVEGLHLLGAERLRFVAQQAVERHPQQGLRAALHDRLECRVPLGDRTIGIQQGLADRGIAHRIAEALLTAARTFVHRHRQAACARLGGGQYPGEREQQQRHGDAQVQRAVEVGQLRRGRVTRTGEEIKAPAPPVEFHRQAVGERMIGVDAGVLPQHHLLAAGSVHHPGQQRATHRGKRAFQHGVDAERCVHPATIGGAPITQRIHAGHVRVHRHVQHGGDRGRAPVTHQVDAATELGCAGIHRGDQRIAAGDLRHHVETHRGPVRRRLRLHVQDDRVLVTDAGWPDLQQATPAVPPVFLQPLQANAIDMRGEAKAQQRREP